MATIARGTIGDRPWGRTFALVVTRRFSGDLVVEAEGKRYVVGWRGGAVVAASSPLAADAFARIAMTAQLINPSQVGELMRALAAAPGRDEVDVLAEAVQLTPELASRLRRRAVAARAMRTFAIAAGDFWLDDEPGLPQHPELAIDARAIAYAGARAHFTDARLLEELAGFGLAFHLRPEASADLAQYGFTDAERPALHRLRERATSPHDLEQAFPDLEPKVLRAMVYALACFGAADATGGRSGRGSHPPPTRTRPASTPPPAPARTKTTSTPPAVVVAPPRPDDKGGDWSEGSSPAIRRRVRPGPRTSAPPAPGSPTDADAIRSLVADRLALLDRGGDHFALLGVTIDTPPDKVRAAYFDLARQLHPDRLAAAAVSDEDREAQRLFAQINNAFGVVSNPTRRAEYVSLIGQGGEPGVRAQEAAAEAMAAKIFGAEEHFRKGEMAMRREQIDLALAEFKQAVELNPSEGEHHALLGWTTYCAAPDKTKIRSLIRPMFDAAIRHAPQSVTPYLYLGRIARLDGRDREAMDHFQKVLSMMPGHSEAASELRILEARRGAKPTKPPDDKPKGGGLFGFIKKT